MGRYRGGQFEVSTRSKKNALKNTYSLECSGDTDKETIRKKVFVEESKFVKRECKLL